MDKKNNEKITEEYLEELTDKKLKKLIYKYLEPVCPHCGKILGDDIDSISLSYETAGYAYGSYSPASDDHCENDWETDGDTTYTCPDCYGIISNMPNINEYIPNNNTRTPEEITQIETKRKVELTKYFLTWWHENKDNAIKAILDKLKGGENQTTRPIPKITDNILTENNLIANRNTSKSENFAKCPTCKHITITASGENVTNMECICGRKIKDSEFISF